LVSDVWLLENRFNKWKSELPNTAEWKKSLRPEIKKLVLSKDADFTLKLRFKYLRKLFKTYL